MKKPLPSPASPPVTLTVLGCGTSTGVPFIHCHCKVCKSRNPRNKRLRCSAWIQTGGKSILIDTSTDLRQQAMRARIPRIDAVLYTHPHADHLHGIDELRSFNYIQREVIPLYGNAWTARDLNHRFGYIFNGQTPKIGGGIPSLEIHEFDASSEAIEIVGIKVTPIPLHHGKAESVGYRFGPIAYVTDCSYIPRTSLDRLKGLSVLLLDCVRLQTHGTHFNLDQALATVEELKPKRTYLTHLGHDFDYATWNSRHGKLPRGVHLAYDGLKIQIGD